MEGLVLKSKAVRWGGEDPNAPPPTVTLDSPAEDTAVDPKIFVRTEELEGDDFVAVARPDF